MTREDKIKQLVPGRQMDAMVAVYVMGYKISNSDSHVNSKTINVRNISSDGYKSDKMMSFKYVNFDHPAPEYSTNIAAAWDVVEKTKLLDENKYVLHYCYGSWRVSDNDFGDLHAIAEGKTAPEAICKAALLTMIK